MIENKRKNDLALLRGGKTPKQLEAEEFLRDTNPAEMDVLKKRLAELKNPPHWEQK